MIVIKPSQVVLGLSLLIPGGLAARAGGAGVKAVGTQIVARDLHKKALFHGYKHGVTAAYTYFALEPLTPVVNKDQKLGIRYGSKSVVPMSSFFMGPLGMYRLPYMHKVPVPTFGYGLTAVPKSESRLPGKSKSRGGEHTTTRSGTPETATKTIVGPLTQKNSQADRRASSITPRAPLQGGGGKTAGGNSNKNRRPGAGPRPPYCWRHKKRHYCKFTK